MKAEDQSKASPVRLMLELLKQLIILGLFWWVGDILNKTLHIPISAGILGMLLLLACLFLKIIKIEQVSMGSLRCIGRTFTVLLACCCRSCSIQRTLSYRRLANCMQYLYWYGERDVKYLFNNSLL